MRSIPILLIIEEALQRCYLDKVLWKYTANLQETTHAKVSEIKYLHGCSTVNLVHIFRTPFRENTSGGLLLISIHCAYWNCFQRELTSYCGSSWTRTQNHLVHKRTLNEVCCEYLYVWCIWMYVISMSSTRSRGNAVAWMSRNPLHETGAISEV